MVRELSESTTDIRRLQAASGSTSEGMTQGVPYLSNDLMLEVETQLDCAAHTCRRPLACAESQIDIKFDSYFNISAIPF